MFNCDGWFIDKVYSFSIDLSFLDIKGTMKMYDMPACLYSIQ